MAKTYPEIAGWLRRVYLVADRFGDQLDPERLVHLGKDRYGERRRTLVKSLDRIARIASDAHFHATGGQTIADVVSFRKGR